MSLSAFSGACPSLAWVWAEDQESLSAAVRTKAASGEAALGLLFLMVEMVTVHVAVVWLAELGYGVEELLGARSRACQNEESGAALLGSLVKERYGKDTAGIGRNLLWLGSAAFRCPLSRGQHS